MKENSDFGSDDQNMWKINFEFHNNENEENILEIADAISVDLTHLLAYPIIA